MSASFFITITNSMKSIDYSGYKGAWKHYNWQKIQLRYFGPGCKIIREKNIEDYIVNNGITKVHLISDNTVLADFIDSKRIELTDSVAAELVVITSQRFSRLDVSVMIEKLNGLLNVCPRIYLALNRYYLNANESFVDSALPEHYDTAIVKWLSDNLSDTIVINRSEIFKEDGSCFTWVVPSCEIILCKK